jgi:hypothetical protein
MESESAMLPAGVEAAVAAAAGVEVGTAGRGVGEDLG